MGQVTVVSGASSGIGRSLARRMAAAGDPVGLLARRAPLLDTLVDEIEAAGGTARAAVCDVRDPAQVRSAIAEVEAALGPVQRLVANAGGGSGDTAGHFSAAHLAETVELNLMGVAHCVEAVLPGMLERGDGHLVAMGSLAAQRGLPGGASYSAAKAALRNLMESLRAELAPQGVQVTLLQPGFVRVKPRKRARPLELELEVATARMQRAIARRLPRDDFPWTLAALLRVLGWLPARTSDRLLARVAR